MASHAEPANSERRVRIQRITVLLARAIAHVFDSVAPENARFGLLVFEGTAGHVASNADPADAVRAMKQIAGQYDAEAMPFVRTDMGAAAAEDGGAKS